MNIIGTDVSKKKPGYVLLTEGSPDKELHGKASDDTGGFQALIRRCCKKAVCNPLELHVIPEATGPYHELAARFFYENGLRVSVVSPAQIKFFPNASESELKMTGKMLLSLLCPALETTRRHGSRNRRNIVNSVRY